LHLNQQLHQLYFRNGSYGPSKTTQAVAVRAIFGPVPLQIFAVAALVTDGFGLTVTVYSKAAPMFQL
jgi:hypothetical protein